MKLIHLLVILVLTVSVVISMKDRCENVKTSLGTLRKKRHLTFPSGSNVVLTIALVKAIMVHAPSGWNIAVEIDVMFPMASPEMMNAFFRKKIHNRQKREFWEKLQNALDGYNINGRSCTYRTICEANDLLASPGKSLVHDILRAIFYAPIHDEGFKEEISDSHRELLHPDFCNIKHDCPISLIDMILTLNRKTD